MISEADRRFNQQPVAVPVKAALGGQYEAWMAGNSAGKQ